MKACPDHPLRRSRRVSPTGAFAPVLAPASAAGPTSQRPFMSSWVGIAAIATAALCWALIGIFATDLAEQGLSPVSIAAWRAAGAGACFAIHATLVRAALPPRSQWARVAVFGVVCVVVFYTALPAAIDAGGITLAYVLLYTAPIFVILREARKGHVGGRAVAVVGFAVVGVIGVVAGGGNGITVSVASLGWGLVAGWSYSMYYGIGRDLFAAHSSVGVYALTLLPSACVLFAIDHGPLPVNWWPVIGLIVVSSYVPYLVFAAGLARVEPERAAVIACLEPVAAACIGWWWYGERLRSFGIIGMFAVIVAAALAGSSRAKE